MPHQLPPKKPAGSADGAHEEPRASFLKRWSDRKAAAAGPAAGTIRDAVPEESGARALPAAEAAAPPSDPPPLVTEADLENLTYESDYTKFMGEHVPEVLRRQALRQLWRSDPVLANLDGLCDYNDDYTDAALAVDVLKTAHRVGQGYLTDDEVAANRARGEPKRADETPSDAAAGEAEVAETGEKTEGGDEIAAGDGIEAHDEMQGAEAGAGAPDATLARDATLAGDAQASEGAGATAPETAPETAPPSPTKET